MLTFQDYENALDHVLNEIEKFPKDLQPACIIHNGHVTTPGISDIDMLIGFDDDTTCAGEFLKEFIGMVKKMDHAATFFPHMPYMYAMSHLARLPKYTFNPIEELFFKRGNNKILIETKTDPYQAALLSFEFIHGRIADLSKQLLDNTIHLRSLLLTGHSMEHSFTLAKIAGMPVDSTSCTGFQRIEEIRANRRADQEVPMIQGPELAELYKLVINEFYMLLEHFYNFLETRIDFYASEHNHHTYDEAAVFAPIFGMTKPLSTNTTTNGVYQYQGFRWPLRAVFDRYFKDYQPSGTIIFNDDALAQAIDERGKFAHDTWMWNLKNYGHPFGRTQIVPLIAGQMSIAMAQIIQNKDS